MMFLFGVLVGFAVGVIYGDFLTGHNLEDCKRRVKMNELRKSAKEKLTPEERKAFGL